MVKTALGEDEEWVTAHPLYLSLGLDKESRNQAYQGLFNAHRADNITAEIRAAWQTGTPLANNRFKEQIEEALKTKEGYARRGRPKVGTHKGLLYLNFPLLKD